MTVILGLSGKKQSGKNTCLNWIIANYLVGLELVDWARVGAKGELLVPAQMESGIETAILDVENPAAASYLDQYVWPFVKNYSFATPLKNFCMDVFGLTYEQVYGTNEQKNTFTSICWEDIPHNDDDMWEGLYITEKSGHMTAREILQYFGTNVCRKMLNNCWVDATIRRIQKEQSQFAIITDVRFPNEVKGIQDAGGKVLRFTRAPFAGQDEHASETVLDGYEGFDAIIDNKDMSIDQQNIAVTDQLLAWNFVQWEIVKKD